MAGSLRLVSIVQPLKQDIHVLHMLRASHVPRQQQTPHVPALTFSSPMHALGTLLAGHMIVAGHINL